jgi:hypothetical protein
VLTASAVLLARVGVVARDAAVELGEALPPDRQLARRQSALGRRNRLERSQFSRQPLAALAEQSKSFGARILMSHAEKIGSMESKSSRLISEEKLREVSVRSRARRAGSRALAVSERQLTHP